MSQNTIAELEGKIVVWQGDYFTVTSVTAQSITIRKPFSVGRDGWAYGLEGMTLNEILLYDIDTKRDYMMMTCTLGKPQYSVVKEGELEQPPLLLTIQYQSVEISDGPG